MVRVSVFGMGYVGAVTAACLARAGHYVIGVDANEAKVSAMASGRAPVLEPGLEELVAEGRNSSRLSVTTDALSAVFQSDVTFVCVGTPSLSSGRLDLSSIARCAQDIGEALRQKQEFHTVVIRSTVLPGTAKSLVVPALEAASGKRAEADFAVCSNPEFTREGCAVADFLNPAITVLGADQSSHLEQLRELYRGTPGKIFETPLGVAEMVKYVCNAFHALKVTFANEIGSLCSLLAVDARAVTEIFTADRKLNISKAYLEPGFAFGGSCLPKDVRALDYRAKQLDLDLPLLRAIQPSNQAHLERAVEAVLATKRKRIGVLGLSFKSGTDDLRESPSVQLIKRLLGEGCEVQVWDKYVSLGRLTGSNRQFIQDEIPHIGARLSTSLEDVVKQSEVVVIGTSALSDEVLQTIVRPDQLIVDLRSPFARNEAFKAPTGLLFDTNKWNQATHV
ncbi:MAG TPA: UDP-glucose/GDP-mannose dehydrogenase family protein [Candidatus Acidoferrum sp.]|nr:UDP-glucose/GDP-mannose dehydrogenase family protein [Candidatus Acidoferrum sp.]